MPVIVNNHYHYHNNYNVYSFQSPRVSSTNQNGNKLRSVEPAPRFGGQDALHFPVIFPSGKLSENLSSTEIHNLATEKKWTVEQKKRLKYGLIIGLSCLALPLLFPFTIHYGKQLSASRHKGDLEKTSERTKIQEKISRKVQKETLDFAKTRKQYTPDEMEKYRLLDKIDGTDEQKNRMYRQYRELYNSIVTTKSFKSMHKGFVDNTYNRKVGKALSSYRWKMAGYVTLEVLSVAVTILAAFAASQEQEKRRPVAAAINAATAANGAYKSVETLGDIAQLKQEYNEKIKPWDKWKKQRYQQIDYAYQRAIETQNLFFKEILSPKKSEEMSSSTNNTLASAPIIFENEAFAQASAPPMPDEYYVALEPSAPPMPDEYYKVLEPSAPPFNELPRKLYPTIEEIDSKNVVICPITQEPIAENQGSSLACGHVFETAAITTWLKKQASCPCCRADAKEADFQTV